MHFRQRGNVIQLVRTAYDAEKKGPKSEVVGRLPKRAKEIPEELRAKLTPQEIGELTTYMEQTREIEELQRKLAAHTLRQTVAQAIEYAEGVTDEAEQDRLRAIFADAVVALRRAGNAKGGERGGGGGGGRRRREAAAAAAAGAAPEE